MRRAAIPDEQRCPKYFERRTRGRTYVNARWRCPRKKLQGLPYCSYCESWEKKQTRIALRMNQRRPAPDGTAERA